MTSRSHKKHQTTPQNIRRGGVSKSLLGAVSVLSVFLCAFLLVQAIDAEESPLDRLRSRSAEKRWKSIRERLSDRRDTRRERVENRKVDAEEAPKEKKTASVAKQPQTEKISPKRSGNPVVSSLPRSSKKRRSQKRSDSQLPSVTPFAADQPIYFEQFQFDKRFARSKTAAKPLIKNGDLQSDRKAAGPIDLPFPSLRPSNDLPEIFPLPGSQTNNDSIAKNVNTAFAPDLPMPAEPERSFESGIPKLNFSDTTTPEEVENNLKAQGLNSQFDRIKPIHSISPFVDYEPDLKLRDEDPGRHLCFLDAVRPELTSNANVQCPGIETLPGAEEPLYRNFAHLDYAWRASNTHSNPLYFEDPNLERYGHIHRPLIQPFASISRFNLQLLGLPYQMAMQPVSKCVYPLGHYRPGDVCTPKYHYQIPLNPWAVLITAEVYTGLFFLIP